MPYTRASDLPSYQNPPVNEVAVGIGFPPLKSWNAAAPGEFRKLVVAQLPGFEDHGLLPPLDGRALVLSVEPPVRRSWYVAEDGRTLVQAQGDRLHANWRRVEGSDKYPSFSHVLDTFMVAYDRLHEYLGDREELNPLIGEVMYVNHILQGENWQSLDKLENVLANWMPFPSGATKFSAASCAVTVDGTFGHPETGRELTLELAAATRVTDETKVLVLTISNRGSVAGLDRAALETWCGVAGDEIVRAFTLLTTDAAHTLWKRVK